MNIDLFDQKTQARFRDLAAEVQTARDTGANHGMVLSDAIRTLRRLNARAEALPAEYGRIEIVPHDGPAIEFAGRLLASDEFTTGKSDPMKVELEIWETRGKALVAVTATQPAEREGIELVWATVIEPQADLQAMQCAVLAHFAWSDWARSMARGLGWSLKVKID